MGYGMMLEVVELLDAHSWMMDEAFNGEGYVAYFKDETDEAVVHVYEDGAWQNIEYGKVVASGQGAAALAKRL